MKYYKREFTHMYKEKVDAETLKDTMKFKKKLSPITAKMREMLVNESASA